MANEHEYEKELLPAEAASEQAMPDDQPAASADAEHKATLDELAAWIKRARAESRRADKAEAERDEARNRSGDGKTTS